MNHQCKRSLDRSLKAPPEKSVNGPFAIAANLAAPAAYCRRHYLLESKVQNNHLPKIILIEGAPMTAKFKVGDLVRLKSGGPIMTVSVVSEDFNRPDGWSYDCIWFAGDKHQQHWFGELTLKLAEE